MKKKEKTSEALKNELFERYPVLQFCRQNFETAYECLLSCYRSNGKLLIAGNGGSAADSEHMVGELMKSFLFYRALDPHFVSRLEAEYGEEGLELAKQLEGGLPAIPLTSMPAISTACANDVAGYVTFAQLVHTLGNEGDVFFGISTSGNSKNVLLAIMAAKAKGMKSICLTGRTGGKCARLSDICIRVPEDETFKIQELHLPVYHTLCAMLEADLFIER